MGKTEQHKPSDKYQAVESATTHYADILQKGWEDFDAKTYQAQAFLLGKAIWKTDGKLSASLHKELGLDFEYSPENLELLGFYLLDYGTPAKQISSNADSVAVKTITAIFARLLEETSNNDIPTDMLDRIGRQLGDVSPSEWHRFFKSIFKSQMTGGWHWRSVLFDAFDGLEAGDTPELFVVQKKYNRGYQKDPDFGVRITVLHIYYLVGQGQKADATRRKIADVIGKSFDTLKTWCDDHRKSNDGKNEVECAKLAGKFKKEFSKRPFNEIHEFENYGEFKGIPNLKRAENIHWLLKEYPIDVLAKMQLIASEKHPKSAVKK